MDNQRKRNKTRRKSGGKKRKKRSGPRLGDHRVGILVTSMILTAAFIFIFCAFYVVTGNYSGLGDKEKFSHNPYHNAAFYSENGFRNYNDGTYHSAAGIDVSTFQHEIDWEKVKKDGVQFTMIRVGYSSTDSGAIHIDDRYSENIRGARRAGIDTGVYFFSQAATTEEAVKEAKFVIRHIRGRGITYPVAFDMEHTENDRISGLTNLERTEIADAFCTIIKQHGYQPVVYGNPTWLMGEVELPYLSQYPIWLAHYTDRTSFPLKYVMWQYTDSGTVDGIKGKVDKDIYIKKYNVN